MVFVLFCSFLDIVGLKGRKGKGKEGKDLGPTFRFVEISINATPRSNHAKVFSIF